MQILDKSYKILYISSMCCSHLISHKFVELYFYAHSYVCTKTVNIIVLSEAILSAFYNKHNGNMSLAALELSKKRTHSKDI